MVGIQVNPKRGEKLPDAVLEKLQPMLDKLLGAPEDVADAVLYAVTQPARLNVAEIVVRPAKQMAL
jgi:NADP-dependent 3-hydroxy acid dehydrogenase YdfG